MPFEKYVAAAGEASQTASGKGERVKHLIRFGSVLTLLLLPLATAGGQERRQVSEQAEEVVRVRSELVQTDVTVLDKRGRFVDGLTPEQFELRVDGRAVPLSFFERVTAGSASEATQLAAAVRARGAEAQSKRTLPQASGRGRVIFFFVDDVHLAPDSLARTRKSLSRFVDEQMGEGDLVAVISTSGQVGFLQQLTDNKSVLHAAIERLVSKRDTETYSNKVPISEVDADRIQHHRDRELFSYLVEATANEYQMGPATAALIVRDRVRPSTMSTRCAAR